MIVARAVDKTTHFIYEYILFFLPGGHPWDYVAHFIVSFAGIFLILFFLRLIDAPPRMSLYIAIGIMLSTGIAKEIIDMRLGKTDMLGDMTANILGIGIAAFIIFLVLRPT